MHMVLAVHSCFKIVKTFVYRVEFRGSLQTAPLFVHCSLVGVSTLIVRRLLLRCKTPPKLLVWYGISEQ